jgi:hypothetical protein
MNKLKEWVVFAVAACAGAGSAAALAGGALDIDFDAWNFGASMSTISNPYWPLTAPGMVKTFTYVGGSDDECVVNRITVDSAEVKDDFAAPYDGIKAQVVLDVEWVVELEEGEECTVDTEVTDDDLTELTYDWYAQDIFGNVWYFGELSRSFDPDEGCDVADPPDVCFEGSWEAGQYGPEMELIAEPGIVVPSDYPEGSDPLETGTYYMQEVAEGAEDMAKILRQRARLSVEDGVEPGEYENCRKTKEWTALEPGGSVEHKWYCADGPGLVLIEGIGGGTTELEVLVEVTIN